MYLSFYELRTVHAHSTGKNRAQYNYKKVILNKT